MRRFPLEGVVVGVGVEVRAPREMGAGIVGVVKISERMIACVSIRYLIAELDPSHESTSLKTLD